MVLCAALSVAGQRVERKIIISGGQYYFTTIHERHQMGTLHTGDLSEPISSGRELALPAGRNYNEPLIPFSWDVSGNDLVAISFLDHPLNDRNEAIKKMGISGLQPWGDLVTIPQMLLYSTEYQPWMLNDPWLWVSRRSNILEGFFFDGILTRDMHYCMVITNLGELTIWNHDGTTWTHSAVKEFPVTGAFNLFMHKKRMYLLTSTGGLYEVAGDNLTRVPTKTSAEMLTGGILILNRDENTLRYLPSDKFDSNLPLKALIENYGLRIL